MTRTVGRVDVARSEAGFTLIEVVAALVIFSVGVLMVMSLTGTLSLQMKRAAIRSEVVVAGQERLDSMKMLEFDSLTVGTTQSSVVIRGRSYLWTVTVSQLNRVLIQAEVTLSPADSLGPSFSGLAYVAESW